MTCLVLQGAAQGKRAKQSPSHREPKNMPRQGLHSSGQPRVWWKDGSPQKSLSVGHREKFKHEVWLPPFEDKPVRNCYFTQCRNFRGIWILVDFRDW